MMARGGANPCLSGVPVKKSENLATGNCSPFLARLGAPPRTIRMRTRDDDIYIHGNVFVVDRHCQETGTTLAPPADGPEM